MSSQVPLFSLSTPSQYPVIAIVGTNGTTGVVTSVNGQAGDISLHVPWRFDISMFTTAAGKVGTWTTVVDTACVYNARLSSDGAQNNSLDYSVTLAVGTWTIELLHTTNSDSGIYTIQLDDGAGVFTTVGTIDAYTASITRNVLASVTGVVVTTFRKRTLRILVSTKNVSSSNYGAKLQQLTLRRTA